jgi:hypothetical protein
MSFTDPSTLCLILLAIIVVLLLIRTRMRLAGQRKHWSEEGCARDTRQIADRTMNADRPLPDDLARWEIQMHETARQLSAQLDAKLSLLQSITAEADRVARRLEEALDRACPALPSGSQAESTSSAAENDGKGFGAIGDAGMELDGMAAELATPQGPDRARSRDEICQLADYGFAPAEIARRVGSPIGEVELVLSLRQSR